MKKHKIIALVLLTVLLAVSAVACAKTDNKDEKPDDISTITYEIPTHVGGEPKYGTLKLQGDTFFIENAMPASQFDVSFTGIIVYSGSYSRDSETLTARIETMSASMKFDTETDRTAFFSALEEQKEAMGEDNYDMYVKVANGDFSLSVDEAINKFGSFNTDLIFELSEDDHIALLIKEIESDGTSTEYEYYGDEEAEEPGTIKKKTFIEADGSSWKIGYSETGTITDYPGG